MAVHTDSVWDVLKNREELVTIKINNNLLTEVHWKRLTKIETIEANYNAVRSVEFRGTKRPDRLELRHNGMTTIPTNFDIHYVTPIKHIDLSHNELSDISGITPGSFIYLTETLILSHNQISDISPFRRDGSVQIFPHLEKLYLADNPICDLRPLKGMTKLCYLEVDPCPEAPPEEFANWIPNPNDCNPPPPEPIEEEAEEVEEPEVKPRRIIIQQCGLGWAPQSQFQHPPLIPKVMIYALEFEYNPAPNAGWSCKLSKYGRVMIPLKISRGGNFISGHSITQVTAP